MKDFQALSARVLQLELQFTRLQGKDLDRNSPRPGSSPWSSNILTGQTHSEQDSDDVAMENIAAEDDGDEQFPCCSSPPVLPESSTPPATSGFQVKQPPVPHAQQGLDSAALVLEDFAMGYIGNQERAGRPQQTKVSNHLYAALSRAVSILPDAERTQYLITYFMTAVDWHTKVLHPQFYLEEYGRFSALPKERMAMEVRPEWLCVHLMFLCLSLHLLDDVQRRILGVRGDQWQEVVKGLFLASREVLFASDFLTHHSLEHLQCIILQGGYQYDADDSADAHWTLIGSAVKIAQNLGLHRLGNEDGKRKDRWPGPWRNAARREVGRRVWWNIVYLDWSHALSHGLTYCVHSGQNLTALPANLNDADLQRTSIITKPLAQYTSSSFRIFRLRFLLLYKEQIDQWEKSQPPDYVSIVKMHGRVIELRNELPSYFSDGIQAGHFAVQLERPCIVSESIAIRMIAANRLLRLHRPYLLLGFRDENYHLSTINCIQAAEEILALYETARTVAPSLLNYWLVIFYAFAAAVIIFIRLCQQEEAQKASSRQLLSRTLETLRGAMEVSAAARNAVSILGSLLDAESDQIRDTASPAFELAQGTGHPEETMFWRIVRRVIGPNNNTTPSHGHIPDGTPSTAVPLAEQIDIPVQLGIDLQSQAAVSASACNFDWLWQKSGLPGETPLISTNSDTGPSLAGVGAGTGLDPLLGIYGDNDLDLEAFLASLTS